MTKTDRDFLAAPLLLLPRPAPSVRPSPAPSVRPFPAAAPPCSRRTAAPFASDPRPGLFLPGRRSRRRGPLVAGDGGTSSTILQRHFPREPRRSVMGSRQVRFLRFSPRVRLTVGSILQSKSYPCSSHLSLCPCICRMDPNSSYRLAVRVGAYVKLTDDDGCEYCKACNIPKILDRDSTNWNHLLLEFAT